MCLFCYAYTNEMNFAPLQTSSHEGGSVVDAGSHLQPSCSPRSMYSLTSTVGTSDERILRVADGPKSLGLKTLRSAHLRTSNPNSQLPTLYKSYSHNSLQSRIQRSSLFTLLLMHGSCSVIRWSQMSRSNSFLGTSRRSRGL